MKGGEVPFAAREVYAVSIYSRENTIFGRHGTRFCKKITLC